MPKENNALLKFENDHGSTVYNVKVDNATLQNIDAADAEKVGDIGCSITTLDDMHQVLEGVNAGKLFQCQR